MTSAGGVTYTWDNNGNLLSDGTYTYTYNHANRLTMVKDPASIVSFIYNGLGDRLNETVNGVTTIFVLDLNTGLTQMLSDGTNVYLYGLGRIAQISTSGAGYFLGDALGSVRQLADGNGTVILAQSYEPYGSVLSSAGNGISIFGYISEIQNTNTGLIFLRARYYLSENGIFNSRDAGEGNDNQSISLNKWIYAFENPVILQDHDGKRPECYPEYCEVTPPNILNYDQTKQPDGITFIGTNLSAPII